MHEPLFLQITLLHTVGRYRSSSLSGDTLGKLALVVWVNGYDVAGMGAMHVTVVDGDEVRHIETEGVELATLWDHLRAAGIPTREPQVSGNLDTSANWHNTSLRIGHPQGQHEIDLAMMESGFGGADAVALRAFFRDLLDLARVETPSIRDQLVGD